MNAIKSSKKKNDSYQELVQERPLHAIRSEKQLDEAQEFVDELLTRELDTGGQAYLDALSDLIIVYEQANHPIEPLPAHQLLEQLLLQHDKSQADLVRETKIAKATISELVSGKRAFTVDQMRLIGKAFHLPAAIFLAE